MNKKMIFMLLLLASGLAACITEPLHLVNAFDDRESCQPSKRYGFLGKILPDNISDDCKTNFTNLGYLPESEAGTINIRLSMDGENIVASSLPDEALQQQPDLETGDKILSIDEQRVENLDATTAMLFGTIGSTVTIVFGRDTMEFPVQLTRQPINEPTHTMVTPEVIPLATDAYNMKKETTKEKPTEESGEPFNLLKKIKHLFSSTTPHIAAIKKKTNTAHKTSITQQPESQPPTTHNTPYSTVSHSPPPIPAQTSDPSNHLLQSIKGLFLPPQNNDIPATIILKQPMSPPPHQIMIGNQVCRVRKSFIDVGTIKNIRTNQALVSISYFQLKQSPYTEFHHFGKQNQWSPLTSWQPCPDISPLFLHRK